MNLRKFSVVLLLPTIAVLALVLASLPAGALRPDALSAVADSASAYFHPNILYFKVGTSSSATTTLTNTGTQTLTIASLSLVGLKQNSFSWTKTCSQTLAAGQSCTVTLTGTATQLGLFGQMIETDNSTVRRHMVALEGK
jgi:hypothetical protein